MKPPNALDVALGWLFAAATLVLAAADTVHWSAARAERRRLAALAAELAAQFDEVVDFVEAPDA